MPKTKTDLPNNEIGKTELSKIITSIQEGDSQGFETLFNLYYKDVYNIAMKNVNDSDKASDITQETFIEIYETISALREPDAFKAWIKKIAYHRCTNYFRSKAHRHESAIDDEEEYESFINNMEEDNRDFLPEEALDQEALKEILLNIMNDLPAEQREAMLMYYYEDMSAGEIAEIQGVSVDTVRSRLYYGRKTMKKAIEEYEKKNDSKLHAIALPIIPLFRWVLDESKIVPPPEVTASIAEGISAATGVTVTAASTVMTAAGVGIAAKVASVPVIAKVVAGIAAVALVAVPTVMYVNKQMNDTHPPVESPPIAETEVTTQVVDETTGEVSFVETEPPIAFESVLTAFTDEAQSVEYISADWTNTDVYINLTTNDENAALYYRTSDADEFNEFEGVLTLSEDGMYSCEFKTVYSDETEEILSLSVNIDKTLPTVSCEIMDKYSPDSLANQVVAAYEMKDSNWSASGENKLYDIQTLDELLEFESKYEYIQYAVTGLSYRTKAVIALIAKEWISNANAYVSVGCTESLSGIKSIKYFINGVEYSETSPQFNIYALPNGEYDISIIITDHAKNTVESIMHIKKNDTPPQTVVSCVLPDGSYTQDEQTLSITSNYGDCWYTARSSSIPNSFAGASGLIFGGITSSGELFHEPNTPYTCDYSSEMNFTAYSLAGLKGTDVKYVLYVDKNAPYINITDESINSVFGNLGDPTTPVIEAYYAVDGVKTDVALNEHNRGYFTIDLPDGVKDVEIYVRDSAGNEFVWSKKI